MNKLRNLIVLFLLLINNTNIMGNDLYSEVLNYIQKDSSYIAYCNFQGVDINNYEVSKSNIDFNCITVLEDYIRTNHLENFSYFNFELVEKNKQLIDEQREKLEELSRVLNKHKNCDTIPLQHNKKLKQNGCIIYFSRYCEEYIYVEILGYNPFLFENKNYNTLCQGKAITYLFKIKDHDIVKSYNGEVHHN